MREGIKDPGRITHMLEASIILRENASLYSLNRIKEDKVIFFGMAKLVEIIGEAAYKLTKEFRETHQELPWKAIIGMRHVMVHDYYTMSPEKIWATITEDIPGMIPILEKYLIEVNEDKE